MVENNNNGQKERSRKKRKKKGKTKQNPTGGLVCGKSDRVSDGGQEEEVGRVRRSSSKDYIVSTNEGPFL